jgi:hypothetical protein
MLWRSQRRTLTRTFRGGPQTVRLLGVVLACLLPGALERLGAQAGGVPASTFRWVGRSVEVSFEGAAGLRYMLEVSTDGARTWHRSSPWRRGSAAPVTLTTEEFFGAGERHYRIVAQPAKGGRIASSAAQLNHILIGGQSNAIGTGDGQYEPMSTVQPFRNVMFNGFVKRRYVNNGGALDFMEYFASGLRAPHCALSQTLHQPWIDGVPWLIRDSEHYRSENVVSGFVPLTEGTEHLLCCPVAECPVFETMASSIANTLTSRRGTRFLASSHGVGSMPIEQLNRSETRDADHAIDLASVHPGLSGWATGPYANGMFQVLRAWQIAASEHLTYKVAAVVWIHADGEDDAAYNRKLNRLICDYDRDIKIITGQPDDVLFFVEQAQWEATGWPTAVDQEYYEVHRDNEPLFSNRGQAFLVGPRYPVPCPFHYAPEGVRSQGARFAHAMDQVLFEGNDWEPTAPRDIRVQGSTLEIDFHVPNGHLQAGTTPNLGPIPGTLGFTIRNASGSNIVERAVFVDPDTLRLECSEDPAGRLLRYAREKSVHGQVQRGFLCDSDPKATYYRRSDGRDYDARNFCIAFEHVVPWRESAEAAGPAIAFAPPATDTDLDGVLDAWEMAVFGNLATADASSDYDGDGAGDFVEFRAGTSPQDPRDVLRLRLLSDPPRGGPVTVGWTAVPGRRYRLEWSEDLVTWNRVAGNHDATGSQLEVTILPAALGGPKQFLVRLAVEDP